MVEAYFELFVLAFHGFHSVVAVEKTKIHVLYAQTRTDFCELIAQMQCLFDIHFYSMNQKVDHAA